MPQTTRSLSEQEQQVYDDAVRLQSEQALGATFARKLLTSNLILGTALLLTASLSGVTLWKVYHPDNHYFATESGRITPIYPLNRPAWSMEDIAGFGADTIQQAFTLDFVHYRHQMTSVMTRFTNQGYADYYKALTNSNVLKMVRDQRMNLSITISPGVVHSQGIINGIYTVRVQYPVSLKLDGQERSLPAANYIIELTIQQTDPRKKPLGLEVRQTIMTSSH
ncbi:TPA: DotI/IcmL/TraM family protein [Klebsiella oxytoca]